MFKKSNHLLTRALAFQCALSVLMASAPALANGTRITFPTILENGEASSLILDERFCAAADSADVSAILRDLSLYARETRTRITAKEAQIDELKALHSTAGNWAGLNMLAISVPATIAVAVAPPLGLAASIIVSISGVGVFIGGPTAGAMLGHQSTSIDEAELSDFEKVLLRGLSSESGIPLQAIDLDGMSPEEAHTVAVDLIEGSRKVYDAVTFQFGNEPEDDFLIDPVGYRDGKYLSVEVEQAEIQLQLLQSEQKMISVFARKIAKAGGCRYVL